MAVIGFILSVLSGILLVFGDIKNFAILYSIGNVITITSTCFLMGPMKQLKSMVETSRIVSTIIFFVALGATLAVALILGERPGTWILVLLCVIIQWLAFTWYSISYIPFAQTCVKKFVGGVLED
eukprot:TRINITY_DN4964_c0_g2_i1.p1 TRINITY_DN4964_c0_g2~~TRINITY_DN4964_c0_g2_i1.p1  ORF type:complete len:125 (+),score=21.83 TRINITY_DN4964_c0_g2_i1:2-376(+)